VKLTLLSIAAVFAVFEAYLRGLDAGMAAAECHQPHVLKGD